MPRLNFLQGLKKQYIAYCSNPSLSTLNHIRLDFIRRALSELGFTDEDLEMRTMLFVCYHRLESSMFREVSRKRRRELIAKRIELLTSK